MKFSLVCPIKDEADLIPYTLPSFYALKPSEIILCLDEHPPKAVENAIYRLAKIHDNIDTIITEVSPNPEYTYQQAWIRRKGFLLAEHDRILNTDIDLILNRNVLKALEQVGKNNVGIASVAKRGNGNTFASHLHRIQLLTRYYLFHRFQRPFFTGLYALWRPYWQDSEPEDKIKRFIGVKQVWRGEHQTVNGLPSGEDSHLKECMLKRHRVIFITEVGGTVIREDPEYLRWLYQMHGRHAGLNGGSLVSAVARTLTKHNSSYLRGYLEAKA